MFHYPRPKRHGQIYYRRLAYFEALFSHTEILPLSS